MITQKRRAGLKEEEKDSKNTSSILSEKEAHDPLTIGSRRLPACMPFTYIIWTDPDPRSAETRNPLLACPSCSHQDFNLCACPMFAQTLMRV